MLDQLAKRPAGYSAIFQLVYDWLTVHSRLYMSCRWGDTAGMPVTVLSPWCEGALWSCVGMVVRLLSTRCAAAAEGD